MEKTTWKILCVMKFVLAFVVLCGLVLGVLPGLAWAGGLYMNEFGTTSMGVAGAGAQAVANDASTSFHNPAGMTRLSGSEFMQATGFLYADMNFDPAHDTPQSGGDGGRAGGVGPMINGFYVHSLTDDLKVGVNLVSITGSVLDNDNDWTGRYLIQNLDLMTTTLEPTVAYRLNDWLSVGAGFFATYATIDMRTAVPLPFGDSQLKVDGKDVAYGYDVGVLIELSERTRFGVIYYSGFEPDFDGDFQIRDLGIKLSSDTKLKFPQMIRTGIYHELNDKFALLGSLGWEDWSTLQNLKISLSKSTIRMPRRWHDTWHYSVGLHYRPVKPWLLQLGFAYDTSPVDSEDRTPDMPMDRQIRYAVGAQYEWSEKLTLGGAFEFADYGDGKIKNDLLKGDYQKQNIYFLAFHVKYKF